MKAKFRRPDLLLLLLLWIGNTAHGQAPGNDNLANAEVVDGGSGVVFGNNNEATLEPDEPATLGGFETYRSVWYSWEAPNSSVLSISVIGDFDTQLAVLTPRQWKTASKAKVRSTCLELVDLNPWC